MTLIKFQVKINDKFLLSQKQLGLQDTWAEHSTRGVHYLHCSVCKITWLIVFFFSSFSKSHSPVSPPSIFFEFKYHIFFPSNHQLTTNPRFCWRIPACFLVIPGFDSHSHWNHSLCYSVSCNWWLIFVFFLSVLFNSQYSYTVCSI